MQGGDQGFSATTSFLPEQETSVLLQDLARVFRQLGVQFVRASVVDMQTLAYQAAWSISDSGEVADSPTDRAMDSAFPGAASSIGQLAQSSTDHTLVQKLSPRRWAYAWRLDPQNAVVAEAQYRERRDAVSEVDTALVRLVCTASIRRDEPEHVDLDKPAATQVWPHVDRRAASPAQRGAWPAVALAGLATAFAAWAAVVSTPQTAQVVAAQQAQSAQLRAMADATLVHGLSTALSTGDYGEAQNELNQFLEMGYFQSAVVTNTKSRVVAMGGQLERMRIGDPVTPEYGAVARTLPLALGSEQHGRLLLVSPPPPPAAPLMSLHLATMGAALAALAATAMLAWRLRRPRRRTPGA